MPLAEKRDWTWRFVISTLTTRTLCYLDSIATNRGVTKRLNAPAQAVGQVPSDDRRINLLHTDGEPYLAMNTRLLYGFRREPQAASSDPVYMCRFGGYLMQPDDEAGTDNAMTHYTAFDPWQRLMHIPVTRDDGVLPTNGLFYKHKRGSHIARDLLINGDAAWGSPFGLGVDYGQFGGASTDLVEDTDFIDMHFDQGTSVGDAWTQLTEQGFDICLDPVYDPFFRPGIVAALRIQQTAGSTRYKSLIAWDKPGRSAVGVSRLQDGSRMANKVIDYASQGVISTAQSDATSIAKFGQYIEQQTISGQPLKVVVDLLAQGTLAARKYGGLTLTTDQAAERSPISILDYDIGDVVPVYASSRLRKAISLQKRVYEIPINIGDDGRETVTKLLVSDPNL